MRSRIRSWASGSPPRCGLEWLLENEYFYIGNILQLHECIQCKYNPKGVHQVYTFLPRLYIREESVHLCAVFRAKGVHQSVHFPPWL
jgi:hypothetical protein